MTETNFFLITDNIQNANTEKIADIPHLFPYMEISKNSKFLLDNCCILLASFLEGGTIRLTGLCPNLDKNPLLEFYWSKWFTRTQVHFLYSKLLILGPKKLSEAYRFLKLFLVYWTLTKNIASNFFSENTEIENFQYNWR